MTSESNLPDELAALANTWGTRGYHALAFALGCAATAIRQLEKERDEARTRVKRLEEMLGPAVAVEDYWQSQNALKSKEPT